jgi:hypothetical protein
VLRQVRTSPQVMQAHQVVQMHHVDLGAARRREIQREMPAYRVLAQNRPRKLPAEFPDNYLAVPRPPTEAALRFHLALSQLHLALSQRPFNLIRQPIKMLV